MKPTLSFCAVCILTAGLFVTTSVQATDQRDLSVALKALPLLTDKMVGSVDVAIVYDPTSPESRTDASDIQSLIDAGGGAPEGIKLIARSVSVADLAGLTRARIIFLAHGLPADRYSAVNAAANHLNALTISTDIGCVHANKCMLGVVSKPSIEIYYSPAAADASKISFVPAFTLLAKQM